MSPAADPAPLLAVVVPALDEQDHLPGLLGDLGELRVPHRVLVVDGGSGDATVETALRLGAHTVRAPRGRAVQMAMGAAASTAPWLFFVHADSRLPGSTLRRMEAWLEDASLDDAVHLTFALDGSEWFWRFIELGQALRERVTGLVYGDQGLLLSRQLYEAVGGYPELPLMEDVVMVDRIRRRGRLRRLDAPLPTSPRRYREEGRWRTWLRHTALIGLFRLGVSPERLAHHHRSRADGGTNRPVPGDASPDPSPLRNTLLVFAKAPRPGRVKTRLAADLGPPAAAEVYRRMGRGIVDAVRHGRWRTEIHFAPADARDEMTAWLGAEGMDFHPQAEGDLGVRMEEAIGHAFERSERVCVVGTDAPGLQRERVEEAFRRLDDHDVVMGPARDGGYYLLALRRPAPGLFRGIPWSTPRVLDRTLERAREAELSVAHLRVLVDVDTVDDLVTEPVPSP